LVRVQCSYDDLHKFRSETSLHDPREGRRM
jgi:hypothetical protein